MKRILLGIVFIHSLSLLMAQKKPLDHTVYDKWPEISGEKISNDGKYVLYILGSRAAGPTLIVQATDNSWKREIKGVGTALITEDSRYVIFAAAKDSIGLLRPGNADVEFIKGVGAFKVPVSGEGRWLAYRLNSSVLVLRDLFTGGEKRFPWVIDYAFSDNGRVLVLQKAPSGDGAQPFVVEWVDLQDGRQREICHGSRASGFVFDKTGTRLAFIVSATGVFSDIRLYRAGMDSAMIAVGSRTPGLDSGFVVSNTIHLSFSPNGLKLFFGIRRQMALKPPVANPAGAEVTIWSYMDEGLQSYQQHAFMSEANENFLAVINEGDGKMIRLEQEGDSWFTQAKKADGGNGDYVLVRTSRDEDERTWRPSASPDLYLVNTRDGNRRLLKKSVNDASTFMAQFSPTGRYLVWYDGEKRHYISYNMQTGIFTTIGRGIPVPLYDEKRVSGHSMPVGVAGWLEKDSAVLVYDRYDIWRVDLDGIKPSVNLTNGYGRKNEIVLRYMPEEQGSPAVFKTGDSLLLAGFNERNKDNGFFRIRIDSRQDPRQLSMAPYAIYFIAPGYSPIGTLPLKAKQATQYVVRRMSASEFPNLYVTADFIHFLPLTDIHPEAAYNWLTAELIHWKMSDGREAEGLLYKPEDFDPHKKYPVIFYYYQQLSQNLNQFLRPELSSGAMNIPWFVSNGYLVCCPDIYYRVAKTGESVYSSVVSAAQWLGHQPWVDSTKMGLQGHSFGGYETNYLVTRTHLFAAAAAAAGVSDLVSLYGSTFLNWGESYESFIENAQFHMGATLWENPDAYRENSPIFQADRVTTPLLLMHNKNDANVDWQQSLEYFAALRRLQKKVWMLEYAGEIHILTREKNKLDYSIRLAQFFDHYLKGAPEPEWMGKGIPYRSQGMETGYEPGYSGKP